MGSAAVTLLSRPASAIGLEDCQALGEYGCPRARRTEMISTQFGHKRIPHALVSFLNKLPSERLSGGWVLRSRGMLPRPGNHVSHQRHEFYRSLGEAVNGLLFMRGIFPSGQQSDTHHVVEPVRQNVGSNALFRKP